MAADLVFGKVSGAFSVWDGGPVCRVSEDEPWEADDPAVVARPEMFKDRPTRVQTSGIPKGTKPPSKAKTAVKKAVKKAASE